MCLLQQGSVAGVVSNLRRPLVDQSRVRFLAQLTIGPVAGSCSGIPVVGTVIRSAVDFVERGHGAVGAVTFTESGGDGWNDSRIGQYK